MMVRVEEARESVPLITRALDALPNGKIVESLGELRAEESAFGLVEGWRGPIWHWNDL